MVNENELGGKWLRPPQSGSAVIFVHGILSSNEGAWTHPNGAYWPRMLISDADFGAWGVGTFGYRTDWKSGSYSISDAADLLREFADEARLWSMQRVIFVCHSMGGIVVRRFLVANQAALIDGKSRIGLFLIASPSLGSKDANRLVWLTRMLGNIQGETLRLTENNIWLNDLDRDFLKLKEEGRLSIRGKELIEDEPVIIKKLLGLWTKVVDPMSAARYFSDSVKIAGTDHNNVGKPASRESEQYKALRRFIESSTSEVFLGLPNLDKYESDRAVDALNQIRQRLASGSIAQFDVLSAIQGALLETRSYLKRRAAGEARDVKTEDLLSRVWAAAGAAIQPHDPQLAALCWVKGHGWADESVWEDPRYKDLPLAINDMLDLVLRSTKRASLSAHQTERRSADVEEGVLQIDTTTFRTVVLLPPFSNPPGISLGRVDKRAGEEPRLESITPDSFAVTINSGSQAGAWNWRARGKTLGPETGIVEGELSLSLGTTTVLLPPFQSPPAISLVRPDGRARRDPKVEMVTEDKFTVSINHGDDQGQWKWRARGELLK